MIFLQDAYKNISDYDIELFIRHQTQNSQNLVGSTGLYDFGTDTPTTITELLEKLKERIRKHSAFEEMKSKNSSEESE